MTRTAPLLLLVLAYVAFVSLGLPDTVFGVAWPSIRTGFDLSQASMIAVHTTGVCGYFLSGLLAGAMIPKIGVGGLLTLSSALVSLALVGYALAPSWNAFFPIGFVMGLGSGAIDAGLNGYAARHFSVRHVNWLHASWGLGASIGPLIMTGSLARGHGHQGGYAVLAGILGSMAVAFFLTSRAWNDSRAGSPPEAPQRAAATGFGAALRAPRVWLHLAAFFVYTGLESSIGQWCFTLLREARGLGVEAAGAWTAAFWGSLTVGRVVLGFAAERIGPDRLLRGATFGIVLGAVAFGTSEGLLGRIGLLVLGLGLAPMYPTLMARTPARVGPGLDRHTVGFEVSAATLGSTLAPSLLGVLVANTSHAAISASAIVLSLLVFAAHEALLQLEPPSAI